MGGTDAFSGEGLLGCPVESANRGMPVNTCHRDFRQYRERIVFFLSCSKGSPSQRMLAASLDASRVLSTLDRPSDPRSNLAGMI